VKNSKLGRAADFFSKSQFTITTEKYNFPKSRKVQFKKIVLNGLRRPQINYEIVVSNYEKETLVSSLPSFVPSPPQNFSPLRGDFWTFQTILENQNFLYDFFHFFIFFKKYFGA